MTAIAMVHEWCVTLGVLTAISISRQEADMKLAAYVPMLADDFPPAAFTAESLGYVAKHCAKGFPTYPELHAVLRGWWREHRRYVALPAPPAPERRPPPTPDQIAKVHASVVEMIAILRASTHAAWPQAQAPARTVNEQREAIAATVEMPHARHLTGEHLAAFRRECRGEAAAIVAKTDRPSSDAVPTG